MIVVNIELHSAINGRTTELGTMIIDNIGGTRTRGDYRCRMYRKGEVERLGSARLLPLASKPTREAQVTNHARLVEPVQNLVSKALTALGYK